MVMRKEETRRQLEQYRQRLEAYRRAELAILDGGQSYRIGSRSFTRATLGEVADTIKYLERRVAELETELATGNGKRKAVRVLPRDI